MEKRNILLLLFAYTLILSLGFSSAVTNTWNCTGISIMTFDNVTCWSAGALPVAGDNVIFNRTGTAPVNITNNTMPQNLSSFLVDSDYNGAIHFSALFANGTWGTFGEIGTQNWTVLGNIDIRNASMSIQGSFASIGLALNLTAGGEGQIWQSLNGNITVQPTATLNGNTLGFATGFGPGAGANREAGAHGARGGGNFDAPYGNATGPTTLGSGGEAGNANGRGGSAIKLEAQNILINGTITMNGDSASASEGGAGGSIWLRASNITLANNSVLKADGASSTNREGGSGGRIRVEYLYNVINQDGVISVSRGTSTSGAAGESGTFTFTNNIWPSNLHIKSNISFLGGNYGDGNVINIRGNFSTNGNRITIFGNCFYSASSSVTCYNTTADGSGVWLNVSGSVDINESSNFYGTGLGFPSGYGPGVSSGDGSSHGGIGGNGADRRYGNASYPISLGSGGTATKGGSALRLESQSNITCNGNITMDGESTSGSAVSSGGSILIIAPNVIGNTCFLSAIGGRSTSSVESGGGGRIAIYGNVSLGNLTSVSGGGATGYQGSGGTLLINSTGYVTYRGNIFSVGGSAGYINITAPLINLEGIYNSSNFTGGDGTAVNATITYSTYSSNFTNATFVPEAKFRNLLVDITSPNITSMIPPNGTVVSLNFTSFNATFTDDFNLTNVTLYVWNSTNSSINQTAYNITGTFAYVNITFNFPYEGEFKWNLLVYDNSSNYFLGERNLTITHDFTSTCFDGIKNGGETTIDAGGNCEWEAVTNYKSGISLLFNGTPAVDYIEEHFWYDKAYDDRKVIYINTNTSFWFEHNDRNVVTTMQSVLNGASCDGTYMDSQSRMIGANGIDNIPNTGDEGQIVLRIDRDSAYITYAGGVDNYTHRNYTGPLNFSTMNHTNSIQVVGSTGLNNATNGWFGYNDSFGDEWHTITYWDDDRLFNCEEPSDDSRLSDGKIAMFVVNPKTPAIIFINLTGSAQYYTTPPKTYYVPYIFNQTTYLTDDVQIKMVDIMTNSSLYYRIDNGPILQYNSTFNSSAFNNGTQTLTYWYNASWNKTRIIVKNPEYPSANETHGKLTYVTQSRLNYILQRLQREPYSTAYLAWNSSLNESYFTVYDDYPLVYRPEWRGYLGHVSRAFNYVGYYILGNISVSNYPDYALLAKKALLDAYAVDYIGHELALQSPMPSKDSLSLGQEQIGDVYGGLAYDSLISLFNSSVHASGITPIEDLKIRDNFAMKQKSIMQFKDNNGYSINAGTGNEHWGYGMDLILTYFAIAMPDYDTPYYGTSGVSGRNATHLNAPYPGQAVSWWNISRDHEVETPGSPNLQHTSRFDIIFSPYPVMNDLPNDGVFWGGPNAFHCAVNFINTTGMSLPFNLSNLQTIKLPQGYNCSQFNGTEVSSISGSLCVRRDGFSEAVDRTHGVDSCTGPNVSLFHRELGGYENPFPTPTANLNNLMLLNFNESLSANISIYLNTKIRRVAGNYSFDYMLNTTSQSIFETITLSVYNPLMPESVQALPNVSSLMGGDYSSLESIMPLLFYEDNSSMWNTTLQDSDSTSPTVTLLAPINGTNITSATTSFNATMTDNVNLSNATLYVWNSTGIVNQTTYVKIGTSNFTNTTFSFPRNGSYIWNYFVVDNSSNGAFAGANFTINYDLINPGVVLVAPINGTNISIATTSFNATFTDNYFLRNATLFVWNASNSALINQTNRTLSGTSGSINISVTLPYTGTFVWNYFVVDVLGNSAFNNSNYTINYSTVADTTQPLVQIVYPSNTTYNTNVSAINYTASDSNLAYCWYSNETTNFTQTTCGTNFTGVLTREGSNTVRVYANDSSGNINSSSVTFFKDTVHPQFTNYTSNSGTLTTSGTATFNATVMNSNGTVLLQINNINYSASNLTATNYNISVSLSSAGSYTYYWFSFSNSSLNNFNSSTAQTYTVNSASTDSGSSGSGGGGGGGGGGGASTTTTSTNTTTSNTSSSGSSSNGNGSENTDEEGTIEFGETGNNNGILSRLKNISTKSLVSVIVVASVLLVVIGLVLHRRIIRNVRVNRAIHKIHNMHHSSQYNHGGRN